MKKCVILSVSLGQSWIWQVDVWLDGWMDGCVLVEVNTVHSPNNTGFFCQESNQHVKCVIITFALIQYYKRLLYKNTR